MDIDFRIIIENIPAIFYRCKCDDDWTMYYISDAIEDITGYPAEDFILNKTRTYTSILHEDDLQGALDAVNEAVDTKCPWEIEYRMLANDGSSIWVHEKGIAAFDDDDKLLYLDGFITDISNTRKLEAELSLARKLESIGSLAAGIAHEINTPSQYINDNLIFLKESFSDIVEMVGKYQTIIEPYKMDSIGEKISTRVGEIYAEVDFEYLQSEIPNAIDQAVEGVERIRKIVSAMKEFSHPGRDEKQLFSLNNSLKSTLSVATNEWKYVADIELDLDPNLPKINCYPEELGQVFLNILVNASHAIANVHDSKEGGERTNHYQYKNTRRSSRSTYYG